MDYRDFAANQYGVIGVAVSGGVDSMCLLHYLVHAGASVVALTVEHGIRGEASREDVRLVETYCHTLGVRCVTRAVDAPLYAAEHHLGLEQAARICRHAFFAEMLFAGEVQHIATAHHLDDQVESTLLNILRGTGLNGLRPMGRRERYIYPFAGYTRAQIEAYAAAYSVPYREDATNGDPAFNRNYLRLEVLPLIEARFPHYRESVARLNQAAAEQVSLLDVLAIAPQCEGDVVYLPLAALAQHVALVKWSIAKALRHFDYGVDIEAVHYQAVLSLAAGESGSAVTLPHGIRAVREYDRVSFWRDAPRVDVAYPFGEGTFAFGARRYVVRPYREGDRLRFDIEKIPAGALIRLRREGDVIHKFGGGTKSLGDYYTDKKVPCRIRDAYPVVADGGRVLVCAADISRDVAVDTATTRIYTLTEED
jgi:tRNA(Ile)-lysidine synthase